jgi:hypothetical protein
MQQNDSVPTNFLIIFSTDYVNYANNDCVLAVHIDTAIVYKIDEFDTNLNIAYVNTLNKRSKVIPLNKIVCIKVIEYYEHKQDTQIHFSASHIVALYPTNMSIMRNDNIMHIIVDQGAIYEHRYINNMHTIIIDDMHISDVHINMLNALFAEVHVTHTDITIHADKQVQSYITEHLKLNYDYLVKDITKSITNIGVQLP